MNGHFNSGVLKIKKSPWLPITTAFIGTLLYLIQSIYYAHTSAPMLDEGLYLYKGWLFVTGQYFPYQEYGPWTNHAPLSFLIPGYAQLIFGPGVRTGRYLMVFLSLIFLIGLWLTAKRMGGNWGAALAIWAYVLTPQQINIYSKGISQLPTAFLLIWMLYFILGKDRSWKEIAIGTIIGAVLVLVRENMIILIPFVALYIFWEHGWKATWISGLIFITVLGFVFSYFWPGILQPWIRWIPDFLLPETLKLSRFSPRTVSDLSFLEFWLVVFQSTRLNLITLLGMLWIGFKWPIKGWEHEWQKTIVFLSTSMAVLYIAHAWGSLGNSTCPTCLNTYIPFFSPLGNLLLIFLFTSGEKKKPFLPVWIAIFSTIVFAGGIGFSTFERTGTSLMEIPIWLQGRETPVYLWQIMANKFLLSNQQIIRLLPFIAGIAIGLFIVLIAIIYHVRYKKTLIHSLFIILLISSAFISILDAKYLDPNCSTIDVISTYESLGRELAQIVKPDSTVYWRGYSPVTLLYLPKIKIFPAQLNSVFSYRQSTDDEFLLKHGFWNDNLSKRWLNEATYVLVVRETILSEEEWAIGTFERIEFNEPNYGCFETLKIAAFKKK